MSHENLLEILQHLRDDNASRTAALVERIKSGDKSISIVMSRAQSLSSGPGKLATPSTSSPAHQETDEITVDLATSNLQKVVAERELQDDRWKQSRDPLLGISHKVLFWPTVLTHITDTMTTAAKVDLQCILRFGSPWLLSAKFKDCNSCCGIAWDTDLQSSHLHSGAMVFADLTIRRVDKLCVAYFDTFNSLFPLLDMHTFLDGVVARLAREGYKDGDPEAVLGLLVFALGEFAIEGGSTNSQFLGQCRFCGCKRMSPPGSSFFNEACRRMEAIKVQDCLEIVQISLLQAAYFGATSRNSLSHTAISTASTACISLLRAGSTDWSSPRSDLVKRAYWLCVLNETLFSLEFRVPLTGIENWEDEVPLPHPDRRPQRAQPDYPRSLLSENITLARQEDLTCYFSAIITLSRLIRRINDIVYSYESACEDAEPLRSVAIGPEAAQEMEHHIEEYRGPPCHLVEEMARQLDCWRDALPPVLQWNDSTQLEYANVRVQEQQPYSRFFVQALDAESRGAPCELDLILAHLRLRFYHARFLLHRPFIYKALHKPQLMTQSDKYQCKIATEAACLWPLSLNPPKDKRHLVPHPFAWTQTFLSSTLAIRACCHLGVFEFIGDDTGEMRTFALRSLNVMVNWLRDVRREDVIADWALKMLEPP
ncbi:hypothetical protein Q7P37_002934 [Cladosporium fusiforme]